MAAEWFVVFLVFLMTAALVILVAVLVNERVKAGVKLPGKAEFYIDAERGWRENPEPPAQRPSPTATHTSQAFLEMKLQRGPNWVYPLKGRRHIYIGRRDDNDLRLTDPTADTRQAVIYREDGRYKINNLSAKRPTLVNGRRITKQNLGDGNTIELGNTKLIFRDRR